MKFTRLMNKLKKYNNEGMNIIKPKFSFRSWEDFLLVRGEELEGGERAVLDTT